MKANRKSAVKWAGTSALAVMLATTSAFAAAPRNDREQQDASNRRSGQEVQSSQRAADGIAAAQRQEQLRNSSAQQEQVRSNDRSWNNGEQARRDQQNNQQYDRQQQRDQQNNQQYDRQQRNQQYNPQYDNRSRGRVDQTTHYRENQRVNVSGRIASYSRERDGYRIRLDRGGSYWVPASRFRGHERDLRVGINISLGGIFRGGVVGIDAVDWPSGAYGYDQGYVRGVIERVDYRSGVLTLRDDATGRLLDVDMRDTVRDAGVDFGDVRPGDFVTLSGQWLRGNIFSAYRIDSVNSARY